MIRRIGDHGFRVRSMYVESVRYAALVIMFLQSIHRLSDLERKKTQNSAFGSFEVAVYIYAGLATRSSRSAEGVVAKEQSTGTQRGIRILKYIRGS